MQTNKFYASGRMSRQVKTSASLLQDALNEVDRLRKDVQFLRATIHQIHDTSKAFNEANWLRVRNMCAQAIASLELRFRR